ncbi:MAG: hypothetical protein SFU91_04725 [Chloroherpetonaceae bacterium]|nr:hypothetical protein [Chloroherpetonaceae bacterium]
MTPGSVIAPKLEVVEMENWNEIRFAFIGNREGQYIWDRAPVSMAINQFCR